jgi:hypothetical protein
MSAQGFVQGIPNNAPVLEDGGFVDPVCQAIPMTLTMTGSLDPGPHHDSPLGSK